MLFRPLGSGTKAVGPGAGGSSGIRAPPAPRQAPPTKVAAAPPPTRTTAPPPTRAPATCKFI